MKRVRSVPWASNDSNMCNVLTSDGVVTSINLVQVLQRLRAVVGLLGEAKLVLSKDDIGLHSIRSRGAMATFLSGVSTIVIMCIVRWSSRAFLEYIREQVNSFTFGVSKNMIKHDNFHTINEEQGREKMQRISS